VCRDGHVQLECNMGLARWSVPRQRTHHCAFSKHYPAENYVIGALSDSLDLMVRWVLRWLSGVRTRLRKRRDLLVEFIVLHSDQAHGGHVSARVSDCSGCCCRTGGQIGSAV
jgi:hypothetical protein